MSHGRRSAYDFEDYASGISGESLCLCGEFVIERKRFDMLEWLELRLNNSLFLTDRLLLVKAVGVGGIERAGIEWG